MISHRSDTMGADLSPWLAALFSPVHQGETCFGASWIPLGAISSQLPPRQRDHWLMQWFIPTLEIRKWFVRLPPCSAFQFRKRRHWLPLICGCLTYLMNRFQENPNLFIGFSSIRKYWGFAAFWLCACSFIRCHWGIAQSSLVMSLLFMGANKSVDLLTLKMIPG